VSGGGRRQIGWIELLERCFLGWLRGEKKHCTSRRHALIVAQVIKLGEKLTDDAVMMFIKLIGRLFSQAHSRKKRRHGPSDRYL